MGQQLGQVEPRNSRGRLHSLSPSRHDRRLLRCAPLSPLSQLAVLDSLAWEILQPLKVRGLRNRCSLDRRTGFSSKIDAIILSW